MIEFYDSAVKSINVKPGCSGKLLVSFGSQRILAMQKTGHLSLIIGERLEKLSNPENNFSVFNCSLWGGVIPRLCWRI
jgi:hypothetical protein